MNKDDLRNKISKRSSYIPGSSTIDLDPISEKRIFKAITNTNFQQKQILAEKYKYLRNQLNRIPTMMEFAQSDSIDPINFMFSTKSKKNSETGAIEKTFSYSQTYWEFICTYEKIKNNFSSEEMAILKFVSKEISNGVRLHEPLLLRELINKKKILIAEFIKTLESNKVVNRDEDLTGMLNIINGDFYKKADEKGGEKKRQYAEFDLVNTSKDEYILSEQFASLLASNENFKNYLMDVLEYSIYRWNRDYSQNITENNLVLYQKYSRKDVCRILNWDSNEESVIYGYKYDSKTNSCPIFVTYQKVKLDGSTTDYNDRFIDNYQFGWQSKSSKILRSVDPDQREIDIQLLTKILGPKKVKKICDDETLKLIRDSGNNGLKLPLFVMKSDNEGGNFYYMGLCSVEKMEQSSQKTKKGIVPIVDVTFNMNPPVKDEILHYLEQNFEDE